MFPPSDHTVILNSAASIEASLAPWPLATNKTASPGEVLREACIAAVDDGEAEAARGVPGPVSDFTNRLLDDAARAPRPCRGPPVASSARQTARPAYAP